MSAVSTLDVRSDFPFLERTVNGKPIIYFDNAATTQKPKQTIERIVDVYSSGIANVHRAVTLHRSAHCEHVPRTFGRRRVHIAERAVQELRPLSRAERRHLPMVNQRMGQV